MRDGDHLRTFIEDQPKSKISIARDMGISKQTLFQYFKSKELSQEVRDRFEGYFHKKIFGVSMTNTDQVKEPELQEPLKPAERDIIYNLTESNRMMAEAMLTDARTRESLTRSNERLTLKVTADVPERNDPELEAIRQAVVEFVIQVAGGKRWKNEGEAERAYSKRVSEIQHSLKETGTQKSSDKLHKVK